MGSHALHACGSNGCVLGSLARIYTVSVVFMRKQREYIRCVCVKFSADRGLGWDVLDQEISCTYMSP